MLQNVNDLEWDKKDQDARLNRMVQFGEVIEVDPVKRRANVKFPALGGVSLWLKIGVRRALGVSAVHTYSVGEQVVCLMTPVGDVTTGAILCATHNDQDEPWTDSADIEGVKYADGTEFSYDMASKEFNVSLLDGSVSIRMTEAGIVFKGKTTFEDPANFRQAVTCDETLDAKGNISTDAELSDKTGTMSSVRETYDDHDHNYDDGTTDKPNQKM
ncbi:MAG: phage baseplate assembly protein V [Kluyvera sp.]|uniref:phage baseplate assembly protein V n=1 Tax=Kluyvera sp. TaxID=1538228 RepID=UPI003A8B3CDF